MPLVSRTRATLRSAEFGFFGVCVNTRTHTPRFCGLPCSAGLFVFQSTSCRPLRTSWLIVGILRVHPLSKHVNTSTDQWTRLRRGYGGQAKWTMHVASSLGTLAGSALETFPLLL